MINNKCIDCQKIMKNKNVYSCVRQYIMIDGKEYHRNCDRLGQDIRCHDCNIENFFGNFHHIGCDMERCPKCKGQLISCNCKNKCFVR